MQAQRGALRASLLAPASARALCRAPSAPLLPPAYARRLAVRLCRPAAAARSTAPSGGGRPDRAASAASAPPTQPPDSGWRTFWTAVDASAWLGTVGASVAFVLTQEAMLVAAPIALPLLALYASRQRERLVAADESARQLARLEELLLDMQAETADEVAAEVGAEVQDLLKAAVAAAAQRGGAANGEVAQLVRALEAKLSAVEGSVLSAGGYWVLDGEWAGLCGGSALFRHPSHPARLPGSPHPWLLTACLLSRHAGTTTRDALAQSAERQGQLANSVMSRLQVGVLEQTAYQLWRAAGLAAAACPTGESDSSGWCANDVAWQHSHT